MADAEALPSIAPGSGQALQHSAGSAQGLKRTWAAQAEASAAECSSIDQLLGELHQLQARVQQYEQTHPTVNGALCECM